MEEFSDFHAATIVNKSSYGLSITRQFSNKSCVHRYHCYSVLRPFYACMPCGSKNQHRQIDKSNKDVEDDAIWRIVREEMASSPQTNRFCYRPLWKM